MESSLEIFNSDIPFQPPFSCCLSDHSIETSFYSILVALQNLALEIDKKRLSKLINIWGMHGPYSATQGHDTLFHKREMDEGKKTNSIR